MKYDTVRVYEFRFYELIESEKKCEKFEKAFDKIRAEIEAIDTVKVKLGDCMNIIKSPQRIKDEVLEIIDKYRNEGM